MINLFVPSSLMASAGLLQIVVVRLVFCCRFQPVEGEAHQITAVLVVVRVMEREGTPSEAGVRGPAKENKIAVENPQASPS